MVRLRTKLHLSRQGRESSLSHAPCLDECNAAVAGTQSAGSLSESGPAELPLSSLPGPTLGTLPEELLLKVASCCGFSDVLRLRRSSRVLYHVFGKLAVIEQALFQLMDPSSSNDTLGRDVLIDMVKAQLDDESRDQDARRDVFLCLAVTIPARQRARVKGALESLLARARSRGSCRDSGLGEDPQDLDGHHNDFDLAAQLERSIGIISTLLIMGYWDICDLQTGRLLVVMNHWSVKSHLWTEKRLLKHKEISLQMALAMVLGLIHPSNWSELQSTPPEFHSLAQRVKADYRGVEFTSSSQSFWLSWEGLQTRSLQLAGLIAYILKIGGLEDVPRSDLLPLLQGLSPIPDRPTRPSNPSSARLKMPLLENFSSTAIRAQPNSWQEWYTSRVRDLVNTIEDEEWYGYYVYTLDDADNPRPRGAQDPAMENVHFKLGSGPPVPSSRPQTSTATSSTVIYSPKLPLEARGGKDGVTKEFDFVGSINTSTGMMNLRKSYRGAHYWDYEGVMTPLGIVGEWGREGTGYDGYFWLWKRSWMVDDAVQRTHAYT